MPKLLSKILLVIVTATAACVPPAAQAGYGNGAETSPAPGTGHAATDSITINGAVLDAQQAQTLAQLEAQYNVSLPAGAYWYDATSGAFGIWGQATAALIPAGLDLGPIVPEAASSGTTGVFVNNRELPPSEAQYLGGLVGSRLQPGRYFVDAQGNAGVEGGPVLVNLVQAANARRAAANRPAGNGGSGGGVHMTAGFGSNQSWFDSDGSGCKGFMTASGSWVTAGC